MGVVVLAATVVAPNAAVASPPAAETVAHGVKNHAPSAPSALRTTDPDATCATDGSTAAVRSVTPTLRALLTDPDGDTVTATFTVRDGVTGTRLWGPVATTPQVSGVDHAVQLPDGLLEDGHAYEWRVQARDAAGRKSPTVRCRITVDVTAPDAPEVSAVTGSAPAVYLENQTAGGVGVAGELRFDRGASTDVVAFAYVLNGAPATVPVADGETGTTITVVPTSSGSQQLTVQSVDAAGNVGAERLYRFTVASPAAGGTWALDEGQGGVAADTANAFPLTLTPSTGWAPGLRAELVGSETDRALLLDGADDAAVSAGPVLDTAASFSVLTFVRLDDTGATATAVSQDGTARSGFELGHRTGSACPEGVVSCWAFTVHGSDAAGDEALASVATSSVPVRAGSWVMLAGVHDAAAGTDRITVCEFGTAAEPGGSGVVTGAAVPSAGGWGASGVFRVGSGLQDGVPAHAWSGAVSGVRAYAGVLSLVKIRMACSSGV